MCINTFKPFSKIIIELENLTGNTDLLLSLQNQILCQ